MYKHIVEIKTTLIYASLYKRTKPSSRPRSGIVPINTAMIL